MFFPEVVWERCNGCEPCFARQACRTRAIMKLDPGEPPYVEITRCNGCFKCQAACPFDAIIFNHDQVLPQIR